MALQAGCCGAVIAAGLVSQKGASRGLAEGGLAEGSFAESPPSRAPRSEVGGAPLRLHLLSHASCARRPAGVPQTGLAAQSRRRISQKGLAKRTLQKGLVRAGFGTNRSDSETRVLKLGF